MISILKNKFFFKRDYHEASKDVIECLQESLVIDKDVTLRDLIKILNRLPKVDLEIISRIIGVDLETSFKDVKLNSKKKSNIRKIAVKKNSHISNIGTCNEIFDFSFSLDCYGIDSKKQKWAIEFTETEKLLDAKLEIEHDFMLNKEVWIKKKETHSFDVVGSDDPFEIKVDRVVDKRETIEKNTVTQMTLLEFLDGLFNEIFFFPNSSRRKNAVKNLEKEAKEYDLSFSETS